MSALQIIDIQKRLVELGRIRMGEKGSRGEPKKLSHFRLTSASKRLLEAAAVLYGGTVREWKDAPDEGYFELKTEASELDILIPPTLASYSQTYELWTAGGAERRCNGVTEVLSGGPCLCDPDARECQVTTRISVMLPKVPGLGVWRLDTKGWNAAATLPSTLELLGAASSGSWIPAVLRIEQRTSKKDKQTRRFVVPVIDIPEVTIGQLLGGDGQATGPSMPGMAPAPALQPVNRKERVARPELGAGAPLPTETAFVGNGSPGFGTRPALPGEERPATPPADAKTGEVLDDIDLGEPEQKPPELLSFEDFRGLMTARNVADDYVKVAAREMFPEAKSLKGLTDEQRGQLAIAMLDGLAEPVAS